MDNLFDLRRDSGSGAKARNTVGSGRPGGRFGKKSPEKRSAARMVPSGTQEVYRAVRRVNPAAFIGE